MALGWQIRTRFLGERGWLGRIYDCCIWYSFSFYDGGFFLFNLMCERKVDQPAGTGFSYAGTDRYVHTMDIVCSSTFCETRSQTKPI